MRGCRKPVGQGLDAQAGWYRGGLAWVPAAGGHDPHGGEQVLMRFGQFGVGPVLVARVPSLAACGGRHQDGGDEKGGLEKACLEKACLEKAGNHDRTSRACWSGTMRRDARDQPPASPTTIRMTATIAESAMPSGITAV